MSETNGKPKGYIPDGYTKKAFVRNAYNLYPDMRFEFRPCLISEQAVILDNIQRDSTTRREKTLATMLSNRLVSCDLDGYRKDVDFLLSLEPKLFDRMCNIVLGNEGGDEDPKDDGTDQQYSQQRQSELEAALAGESVEENSAKN